MDEINNELIEFFKTIKTAKKEKEEETKSLIGDSLENFFTTVKVAKKETKDEFQEIIGNSFLEDFVKPLAKDYKQIKEQVVEIQTEIQEELEKEEEVQEVQEEPKKEQTLIEKSLGLLSEPSNKKMQNDPLTPLDQKFATLEDLQKHYSTFLSRIQQQLSTLGGGGETRLRYLDDVVGVATNSNFYDDKFLQWNSTTNKSEFVTINSGNISGISTGYYGNFFDTTTQNVVGVNTYQPVRLNTTDLSNQVSIANSSHIVVANSGVYNIQFSLQIDKTQGSQAHIYIWLKKNGVDVPNSASEVSVQGTLSETIAAWNFVVASNANDYYELMWSATDSHIRLKAVSANGVVPAIPSVIVSVVSV